MQTAPQGFENSLSLQGLHTVLEHRLHVWPWLLMPQRKVPQAAHHVGELIVATS
jgi:hypothetical protein